MRNQKGARRRLLFAGCVWAASSTALILVATWLDAPVGRRSDRARDHSDRARDHRRDTSVESGAPPQRGLSELEHFVGPTAESFRGQVRLKGQVVNVGGEGIEGALVQCRPYGFHPFDEITKGMLRATSGRDGWFEYPNLPESVGYRLRAIVPGEALSAESEVYLRDLPSDLILVVRTVLYYRLRLIDEASRAVDVSDLPPPFPLQVVANRLVFHNKLPGLSRTGMTLPGTPIGSAPNEILVLLLEESRPKLNMFVWTLSVPRYQKAVARVQGLQLSRSSEAQTVILRRDENDRRVRYHVVFPEIAAPDTWRETVRNLPLFALHVRASGRSLMATRAQSTFFLEGPSEVEILHHPGFSPIPFEEIEDGLDIVLRPEYPDYAYLDLKHGYPPHAANPSPVTLNLYLRPEGQPNEQEVLIRGYSVHPGYARFGPVPCGWYSIVRRWMVDERPGYRIPASDLVGPIELTGGLNVFEWQ